MGHHIAIKVPDELIEDIISLRKEQKKTANQVGNELSERLQAMGRKPKAAHWIASLENGRIKNVEIEILDEIYKILLPECTEPEIANHIKFVTDVKPWHQQIHSNDFLDEFVLLEREDGEQDLSEFEWLILTLGDTIKEEYSKMMNDVARKDEYPSSDLILSSLHTLICNICTNPQMALLQMNLPLMFQFNSSGYNEAQSELIKLNNKYHETINNRAMKLKKERLEQISKEEKLAQKKSITAQKIYFLLNLTLTTFSDNHYFFGEDDIINDLSNLYKMFLIFADGSIPSYKEELDKFGLIDFSDEKTWHKNISDCLSTLTEWYNLICNDFDLNPIK